MAKKTSTKRTHTPKPNKNEDRAKALVTSEPTELHKALAEYVTAQTGYEADVKTIQLALSLRGQFNKAPEREAARKQAKEIREIQKQERIKKQEERKAAQLERLAKQAEKLGMSLQAVQAQKNK